MARSIKAQRAAAKADPDGANTVLVRDKRTTRGGKSRATWVVSTDFAPAFDAVSLCEAISDEILEANYQAVAKGQKADGSGAQPPLDANGEQGRLASKGKRPALRGVRGNQSKKPFAESLTRKKITVRKRPRKLTSGVEGVVAATTIEPDPAHKAYVRREARGDKVPEGVEFFYVEGAVEQAIERVLSGWADLALEGEGQGGDEGEHAAR